jgi:hypothetical protein
MTATQSAGPSGSPFSGFDPFTRFWSEFASKMTAAGSPPPQPPPDVFAQMRRMFFDTLSKHSEEFLRSEAFLNAMKQAMDSSLAWQQQINQIIQKGLAAAQVPSRADADHLVSLVRGMEDRLMDRLEKLAGRVERLEKSKAARPAARPRRRGRPA